MKKKLYISWHCAECKKTGIAEVELPAHPANIIHTIDKQHDKCKWGDSFVEIRNVEVAVK